MNQTPKQNGIATRHASRTGACRRIALTLIGLGMLLMSTAAMARDEKGELIRPQDSTWLKATSIEDVLQRWPQRIDLLLGALDLEQSALSKVNAAVEAGDKKAACSALLDYYREEGQCEWLLKRLPEPNDRHLAMASDILERKHHKGTTVGVIPETNGAWDWNYTGPKGNREFAFNLNRHQFFPHLLLAYRQTGDEQYARAFDRIVRDWILHTVYPGEKDQYVWTWRVLEAGLRMRSWTIAFHGFLHSDSFTPAGRLLMLSSLVQHGRYIKLHHWRHHNHALMEHDGLNRLGLALPELKEAEGWHQYAVKEMLSEMDHQVYPDGAHDELSSGYHWVSLNSYEEIDAICRAAGRSVPGAYRQRIIEMYDYWAGLVRPDQSLPQNNRSDRGHAKGRLLAAAETYNRPDWRYMATNGAEGEAPAGLPSRMAPWAGHLVSRDSWAADALWSFFDCGPAGAGWVHADALHLSVTAWGKDFLVDSGRFWYMRDQWTDFAHASRSHNVILIDGCDQKPEPKRVAQPRADDQWALTDAFDYARATHDQFEDLQGKAAHTRIVIFLRETGWVVIDRIVSDRARAVAPLWHFRPERQVEVAESQIIVTTDAEGANLSITPTGAMEWDLALVRGQEEPHLQGWHSEVTTEWEPATCAEYQGKVDADALFGWILLPVRNGTAQPAAGATLKRTGAEAMVRFTTPTGDAVNLTVPLESGVPILER